MKEKLIYFHNAILPLITFIVCLGLVKTYGITIKGLINIIMMIYSLCVIYSFSKHIDDIKK